MMDLSSTVAQLKPHSRFEVPPGTYSGDLKIRVPALTLWAQPGSVTISGGRTGITVWDGTTDCVIDGLTFVGQSYAAVNLKALSHRSVVRNCRISGGVMGILSANAHDVLVEKNLITDMQDHAVYLSQSGDRLRVLNNICRAIATSALQLNSHDETSGKGQKKGAPPEYDGLSFDCLVEGNLIEASGAKGGSAINLSGVCRSVVRENIIRGMRGGGGISLFKDNGGGLPCDSVRVEANHIVAVHHGVQVTRGCKNCLVTEDNEIVGNPPHDWQEKVRTA